MENAIFQEHQKINQEASIIELSENVVCEGLTKLTIKHVIWIDWMMVYSSILKCHKKAKLMESQ